MENVSLEIKDYRSINNAVIRLKKINVVGGVNGSGKSTVSKLLYCYLKSQELLENEGFTDLNPENVKFTSNSTFSDIFYLENISILDLKDSNILNLNHVLHLKKCLEIPDNCLKSPIISKIQSLTNGDYYSSAGIKQIGVIQILLENNSLKKDSFLFIDEPESNLHPDWQVKFAEILVLLTKELNVTLYLNSYSPIFIEAISLYSNYYELINDTCFYLTKKQENDKFNFKKIHPRNMGEVYENLTKSYDTLDNLKAKILFKE